MRRLATLGSAWFLILALSAGPASAASGSGGISGLVSGFSTTSESGGYGSPSTSACSIGQTTSPAVEYARCALEYDISFVPDGATITRAILMLNTRSVPACDGGVCFMDVAGYIGNAVPEIGDVTAGSFIESAQMGYGQYAFINATSFVASVHEAHELIAGFRIGRSSNNPDDDRTIVEHPASEFPPTLTLYYGFPQTLTVELAGTGAGHVTSDPPGIDCPGDCSESFVGSSTVVLTAEPLNGGSFDGWQEGTPCVGPLESCKMRMPDSAVTVQVFFTGLTPSVSAPPSARPTAILTPPPPSASSPPTNLPATSPPGSVAPLSSDVATVAPSGFEPAQSESGSIGSVTPGSSSNASGAGAPGDPTSGGSGTPILPVVVLLAVVLIGAAGLFTYRDRLRRRRGPPA